MKPTATLLLAFLSISVFGKETTSVLEKPKVDERVELLSIVFRLAGNEEYCSENFKLYTDKIQAHYNAYKDHELIQFIKKIKQESDLGYDAVMSMAIHLDNGLNPLVEFTDEVPNNRWGKENAQKFVNLLKKFYKDTDSKTFFKNNQNLYNEVSKRFLAVYEQLDLTWYKSFYGKEPNEKFIIVNALGNGNGNYGTTINFSNGKREVYAIMGTWKTDSVGMAEFPTNKCFPILLHEFNHSFVNYLVDNNPEPFQENGEIIYNTVASKMKKQSYDSWQIMLNEALVRAAVIKYMKDHKFSEQEVLDEINYQLNRGFWWIKDLVTELENFDLQRNIYPTLESYLPNIIKAYEIYAKRPAVISINEFSNGDQNVEATMNQVTINFDRPLLGKGYSINLGKDGNKDAFPDFKNLTYSDDKKSVIIEWNLESNKVYQFVLTGISFKTPEGIPMEDYEINFKTK
jgi:hypothetical protein